MKFSPRSATVHNQRLVCAEPSERWIAQHPSPKTRSTPTRSLCLPLPPQALTLTGLGLAAGVQWLSEESEGRAGVGGTAPAPKATGFDR